jgi:hypothetical protein
MRMASLALVALVALAACSRQQGDAAPNREPHAPSAWTVPSAPPVVPSGPARPIPNAPGPTLPPNAVAEKAAGPPRDGCAGLFDPPEGAVKLCDEHVVANGSDIHWTSWAVTSSRTDAFRPYEQRAATCSASVTTTPPLLTVSKEAKRLSIHEATETGYPTCANRAPATHPTVVIVSVKVDRR